jgi:hypothetical protein
VTPILSKGFVLSPRRTSGPSHPGVPPDSHLQHRRAPTASAFSKVVEDCKAIISRAVPAKIRVDRLSLLLANTEQDKLRSSVDLKLAENT